jgi:hypothetical protein
LHALQEWIDLGHDQVLLLEIDEDYAVVTGERSEGERSESTQVKFSGEVPVARSISLRSLDVIEAIGRYWERSNGGEDRRGRLRFLTNRGAVRERGAALPDERAGMAYWNDVARDGDLTPLRKLLIEIFRGKPVGAWLASHAPDQEVRSRLVSRVAFVLGAPDDGMLRDHIRERLGMIYLEKGHYETAADAALPILLDRVLEAASSPDSRARRLTAGHLHRALEESIPRMGAVAQAQWGPARPVIGAGVTPLQLQLGLSARTATLAGLLQRVRQSAVVWLHGANGVGKSTLAKLMASSLGCSWLVCDFRTLPGDAESRGAVGIWHELMAALASGPQPDGIILDDIGWRGVELLKNRLAGLAAAVKTRGARIIITSNHTPSSALLVEIGATAQGAQEAPYFTAAEVRELVEQPGAPEAGLIDGWANLVFVSTYAGHPLLVTAKIANLRVRGWPDRALLEDLGAEANEGVKGTRADARRRLLADLPPQGSARAVLERISTVFQSFEDGLVQRLSLDPPEVPHPSDALALLKGSWLEPAGGGGWRLSPLLADLSADVPPERAQRWRQIAAVYWLSTRTLDARTLPLCFWNAYFGRHMPVLLRLSQVIMTLPSGQLQSAAAMLSPLAAFPTDQPILVEEPMTGCGLRLLQIVVADATEYEEAAGAAAEALLREIDAVPVVQFCELETQLSAKVVLCLDRVWIPARTQIRYLLRLRASVARVRDGDFRELKESIESLERDWPKGADIAGLLLAGVFMRMRDTVRLRDMIEALGEIGADERAALLQSVEATLQDRGTFIHNAWANEQLKGSDLRPALGNYRRMRSLVADWGMPALEAELAIAESVMLDESLDDRPQALAVVEAAIEKFGKRPALVRQKSKVLRHEGLNEAAASLLIEIEDEIGALAPFDQGLALRDGAVAAALAKRHDDAIRLLRKADAVFAATGSQEAMRVGLTVDEAMVLWEQGLRVDALRRAADALEAVEAIDPSATRQSLRSHRAARAVVGLFFHDVEGYPRSPRPSLAPGMGSQLEGSERPDGFELSALADNWRILEVVELDAGVEADIAKRSATKQGTSRVVTIEANLAKARFARALEAGDTDGAVGAIVPAVSLLMRLKGIREGGQGTAPGLARAEVTDLAPLDAAGLAAAGWREMMQGALGDIMLMLNLHGLWTSETSQELKKAVAAHWKSDALLTPLLNAACGAAAVNSSTPMPILTAFNLLTVADGSMLSPRDRVGRDLYWLYQTGNSMGRRVLEPMVVRALADGWRYVLDRQTFMLSMPARSAPAIEAAIKEVERRGIRAAPELIDAAAGACGLDVSPWGAFLAALGGNAAAAA